MEGCYNEFLYRLGNVKGESKRAREKYSEIYKEIVRDIQREMNTQESGIIAMRNN